ncbi:Thioredoxin: cytochrome c biogenesis [gamma proteobacterium HdN1]|nr:Thioredoxin: cytochrome c biogenesis [gamma proteobacterium HdN1]
MAFVLDSSVLDHPEKPNEPGNVLRFHWKIHPGYYLYKDKFHLTALDPAVQLGPIEFQQPSKEVQDLEFGKVDAYFNEVTITVPVLATPDGFAEVRVQYQGCAEKGLCYLPQSHTDMYPVTIPTNAASPTNATSAPAAPTNTSASTATASNGNTSGSNLNTAPEAGAGAGAEVKVKVETETASGIEALLASSGLIKITLIFFGLGLALSLTPCVLPMVPILSSLIVGQGAQTNARRGFALSSAYVGGMALTYTLAGALAGASGAKIQYWLQQPSVLIATAVIFVLLSLSMFGFYELQLPRALQERLHKVQDGTQKRPWGHGLAGVGLMGALSALVMSPCISAPLMGAILYISNTGDALLGGFALFALSLGMGAPLIVLGTTGANILPRAGAWMDNIKGLFGVLLLGTGLWITQYLLDDEIALILWGALALLAAIYLGVGDTPSQAQGKFFKGIGWGFAAFGASLILAGGLRFSGIVFSGIGASGLGAGTTAGGSSLNAPDAATKQQRPEFIKVSTERALDLALASARSENTPVMIDVWADWCIACKIMEKQVLSRPDVLAALKGHLLIKLDLTDTLDGERLLERFNLPGPPAYLFLDNQGNELQALRLVGTTDAPRFLRQLQALGIYP